MYTDSQSDTPVPTPHDQATALDTPIHVLSPFERVFVGVLILMIFVSGTTLLYGANKNTLVRLPRPGGTYTEGVVGTPRFINPLLSASEADRDLTALVYAGLMTHDKNGALVPELASGYTLSEDMTTYTFTLRKGLVFQDGTPLTSADVVYTVEQAANGAIRSPYAVHWDGVVATAPDESTVVFTLPAPYAPFIENTTLGILPKHVWGGLAPDQFPFSQFNITPVGAGPYKVANVVRDTSGIPARYELARFDQYALGAPNIEHLNFALYQSNDAVLDAFVKKEVDAVHGVSPEAVNNLLMVGTIKKSEVHQVPQLRTYGIFFNQNKQPIFLHDEVRAALEQATPKQQIIDTVLHGYGQVIDTPAPPFALSGNNLSSGETATTTTATARSTELDAARSTLEEAGWKRNDQGIYTLTTKKGSQSLEFTIATVNIPELAQAANLVAASWRELGAQVEVKVYESTDLTQSVIRPRKFDALLFGTVVGHEVDLYAFWHSSQRNDPRLNIAEYADIESDGLLEKARTESNTDARNALTTSITDRIRAQHAAIFLYAPDFMYLVRDNIQQVTLHPLTTADERFDTVQTWYIEVEHVWPFVRDLLH
jgi:peptide/nickel transport system substrate-binding protein